MTDERWLLCDPTSDARWTEIPVHRSITSNDLMAGERVIIIRHDREEYRLRLTASGKLILTK
jgi:hemin uptake protein HemP